jgi:hypothetical protein
MTGTRVCARLKGLFKPHHGVLNRAVVLAPLPRQVSTDGTSQRVVKPQEGFLARPSETITEVLRGDLRLLRERYCSRIGADCLAFSAARSRGEVRCHGGLATPAASIPSPHGPGPE